MTEFHHLVPDELLFDLNKNKCLIVVTDVSLNCYTHVSHLNCNIIIVMKMSDMTVRIYI